MGESSLPSLAMAMAMDTEDTEDTVDTDTVDITARGRLMLSPRLMLRPPLPPSLDTDTTVMDMVTMLTDTATPALTLTVTTVTTARGPLMPSPDMVTTAEDTDTGTDTDTVTDTEDTTVMARGPLMPSPDMVTTAEGTEATTVDTTVTVTDTDTATTDEAAQEVHVYQSDQSSVQMKLDLRVLVI